MAKDDESRRTHLRKLAGMFLAGVAASNTNLFGQEAPKLSNGDLEKQLEGDLKNLIGQAKANPALAGAAIGNIEIKIVKPTKLPYNDFELTRTNRDVNNSANDKFTITFASDTLNAMDTPEQRKALLANAFCEHLLRNNPEKLKAAGLTNFAKNRVPAGLAGANAATFANYILPLRADEIAIGLMGASPENGAAKSYLEMLNIRKFEQNGRLDKFIDQQGANIPREPKSDKDARSMAEQARQAVLNGMRINNQSIDRQSGNAVTQVEYDVRQSQVIAEHPEVKNPAPAKPAPVRGR